MTSNYMNFSQKSSQLIEWCTVSFEMLRTFKKDIINEIVGHGKKNVIALLLFHVKSVHQPGGLNAQKNLRNTSWILCIDWCVK